MPHGEHGKRYSHIEGGGGAAIAAPSQNSAGTALEQTAAAIACSFAHGATCTMRPAFLQYAKADKLNRPR